MHRVATDVHVDGFVGNDTDGVFAEVEGDPARSTSCCAECATTAPALARVEAIEWDEIPTAGTAGFRIVASRHDPSGVTFVPSDAAVCDDCLRELFDRRDRRYRYPFVNCTNCGPRFTITTTLPYDRRNTTMAGFPLCVVCRREYEDRTDRRYHAEPLACPACGPQLRFVTGSGEVTGTDAAIAATHRALLDGASSRSRASGVTTSRVTRATTTRSLDSGRASSGRPKPFAVMARDLETACRLAPFDDAAVALLDAPPRGPSSSPGAAWRADQRGGRARRIRSSA